ncbi:leucine-rich repeat-containing protein 45 [Penaeus vannamei]|uniref:leucine-rich repeat-containing protein 45 n=1 Tax=Penaeus vannamei TaxID=6689 RepID=UPI000F66D3BC|nr:leucine-rich repeat-containing protein 45-like isoform X1 [Penaeus vannamei]XP_027213925.1 leucine-rich repeat-containing protein 45-like [Penaeus vannamei]
MSNPCELFKALCKKYNIEVQDNVCQALSQTPTLDLANQTLAVGTCAVLGKILQSTTCIRKASFEDCLLEEDGIKSILLGLCGNSSVKTLSLKGNSIQGNGTHAVSKMLRHNSTITRLSLEWNNLGLCTESFAAFCESAGNNSALQYLDLRSNQLGTDAAVHIAQALAKNNTLTAIDIRWNSLGKAGGKTILESLHHNRNLKKIDLVGNNIPNDIISSIEQEIAQNSRAAVVTQKYTTCTEVLKQQLEHHERHSTHEIERLQEALAETELKLNKTIKQSSFHTGQLEESLHSKKLEVEAVESKLSLVTSALQLCQERLATIESRNKTLEEELQRHQELTLKQSNRDRETMEAMKTEHSEIERTMQNTIAKLEAQIGELEFQKSNQKRQVLDLREMVCSLQSEVKGARVECEELVSSEVAKHKEVMRMMEQQHNTEVQRIKNEYHQVETEMRDKLSNMEARRSETEVEITSLRVQVTTERTTAQSQQTSLRQQLKAEHAAIVHGLEERLRSMEESRNDAEERMRSQIATCSSLTATNAKLNTQLHALRNQLTQVEAEVEGKALEVKAAESRVRDEVKLQLEELEQERIQTAKLNNTISQLQRTIAEKQLEYQTDCRNLEDEVRRAKLESKQYKDEIQKLKEDEVRRVGMLHSAFVSYFNASPTSPGALPAEKL